MRAAAPAPRPRPRRPPWGDRLEGFNQAFASTNKQVANVTVRLGLLALQALRVVHPLTAAHTAALARHPLRLVA